VNSQCSLHTPRYRTFPIRAIIFSSPKHSSISFHFLLAHGVAHVPVVFEACVSFDRFSAQSSMWNCRDRPAALALVFPPENSSACPGSSSVPIDGEDASPKSGRGFAPAP
jgi:hypothetical protein